MFKLSSQLAAKPATRKKPDLPVTAVAVRNREPSPKLIEKAAQNLVAETPATVPDLLNCTELMYRVVKYRRNGLDYATISALEEIPLATIGLLIKEYLLVMQRDVVEDRQFVLMLEQERLETLWKGIAPAIEQGDLKAIMAGVAISRRKSELMGLDQPEIKEIRVETGVRFYDGVKGLDDL
jgi:hypothetical protein